MHLKNAPGPFENIPDLDLIQNEMSLMDAGGCKAELKGAAAEEWAEPSDEAQSS